MLGLLLQGTPPATLQSWQLLLLCIGLILGLLVVTKLIVSQLSRENALREAISEGSALQLLTVCAIVATVLVLGLSCKLDSQAAATVLSGVAGYVLGSMSKRPKVYRKPSMVESPSDRGISKPGA